MSHITYINNYSNFGLLNPLILSLSVSYTLKFSTLLEDTLIFDLPSVNVAGNIELFERGVIQKKMFQS